MIEQAEIDLVKRETDLVKLVESSGVKLKRKGKQLAGLCPFHDDHEPSLIVDPKKQLWNCLGACSEGGDVYRWVMKRDRLDFRAAHRRKMICCGSRAWWSITTGGCLRRRRRRTTCDHAGSRRRSSLLPSGSATLTGPCCRSSRPKAARL